MCKFIFFAKVHNLPVTSKFFNDKASFFLFVVQLFCCFVVLLIAFLICEDNQLNNKTTKQQDN